ncbi:unnamed protein product [Larinioides sclopetarius]|uniref:Uncharacterized protein n=1 Tax=Larinioides sclopetarius TaxID=280406 RepID=A0AAV2B7W2_9ARAC
MNTFITVALICSLAASVIAHHRGGGPGGWRGGPPHGGPGGPPHGGPGGPPHGGPGGPRGPPPNMYDMLPACKTLAESMRAKHRELHDSGEIGPGNCQDGDHKVCMQRDMETVRCAVSEQPEQACIDEMMAFIQGDVCNGERGEDGGDSVDSTDEDSP